MMRSPIGSATIAFSVKLKVASDRFQMSRKYGEARAEAPTPAANRMKSRNSQLLRMARSRDGRWTGLAVLTLSSRESGNTVTPSFP